MGLVEALGVKVGAPGIYQVAVRQNVLELLVAVVDLVRLIIDVKARWIELLAEVQLLRALVGVVQLLRVTTIAHLIQRLILIQFVSVPIRIAQSFINSLARIIIGVLHIALRGHEFLIILIFVQLLSNLVGDQYVRGNGVRRATPLVLKLRFLGVGPGAGIQVDGVSRQSLCDQIAVVGVAILALALQLGVITVGLPVFDILAAQQNLTLNLGLAI